MANPIGTVKVDGHHKTLTIDASKGGNFQVINHNGKTLVATGKHDPEKIQEIKNKIDEYVKKHDTFSGAPEIPNQTELVKESKPGVFALSSSVKGNLEDFGDIDEIVISGEESDSPINVKIDGDGEYGQRAGDSYSGISRINFKGSKKNDSLVVNNLATFGVNFEGGNGDDSLEATNLYNMDGVGAYVTFDGANGSDSFYGNNLKGFELDHVETSSFGRKR